MHDPAYKEAFDALATWMDEADYYAIRESDNSTNEVVVVYIEDDGSVDGNRDVDVPTVAIEAPGFDPIMLTWQQARALATAITVIEGIARNG